MALTPIKEINYDAARLDALTPEDRRRLPDTVMPFFQALGNKVSHLNKLIVRFNQLTDDKEKALQLQLIKAQFKNIHPLCQRQ